MYIFYCYFSDIVLLFYCVAVTTRTVFRALLGARMETSLWWSNVRGHTTLYASAAQASTSVQKAMPSVKNTQSALWVPEFTYLVS